MRVIVFYDLPTITSNEQRNYRKFRKFLIRDGYVQLQESVYCKLALNAIAARLIVERLRKNVPNKGLVQSLVITEKQFAQIEYLVGTKTNKEINSEERLIVL